MVNATLQTTAAKAAKTQQGESSPKTQTTGQDVPKTPEELAQDAKAALLESINGPSKLAQALQPLGVAALTLIDSAREELAAKLQDQIKVLAAELLAPFVKPVFTLSASPAANIAACRSEGSSMPSFYKIDSAGLKIKDAKPEPMPVRDIMIGMRLMSELTDNGCYLVIKGADSYFPVKPDLLAQAAQAARMLNPALLPSSDDVSAYGRAERLLAMAQALNVPVPAETTAQREEREAAEAAKAAKAEAEAAKAEAEAAEAAKGK